MANIIKSPIRILLVLGLILLLTFLFAQFSWSQLGGTIAGYKFNDLNGNGAWDTDEPPLASWEITLQGPVTEVTYTDDLGRYRFEDLPAGTYKVSETLRSGWIQTFPPTGNHIVELQVGAYVDFINFGNHDTQPPEIYPDWSWDAEVGYGKDAFSAQAQVYDNDSFFDVFLVTTTNQGYSWDSTKMNYNSFFDIFCELGVEVGRWWAYTENPPEGYAPGTSIEGSILAIDRSYNHNIVPIGTIIIIPNPPIVKPISPVPLKRQSTFEQAWYGLATNSWCGPTAASACLQRLQIPGLPEDKTTLVFDLARQMNTDKILKTGIQGTGDKGSGTIFWNEATRNGFVNGIHKYLGILSQRTNYKIKVYHPNSDLFPDADTIFRWYPTFQDYENELHAGEDVLIRIRYGPKNKSEQNGGHWLVGMGQIIGIPPQLNTIVVMDPATGDTSYVQWTGNEGKYAGRNVTIKSMVAISPIPSGTICVNKYWDFNHNQQLDDGEPPMSDVKFNLLRLTGGGYSATTGVDGKALFENIEPGVYDLTEKVPPGYYITFPKEGIMHFTIVGGENIKVTWLNGKLGGTVCVNKYFDKNHNQQFDTDEPPMPGVTFHLKPPAGGGYREVTGYDGKACFENIDTGYYELTEELPSGYIYSSPKEGLLGIYIRPGSNEKVFWLNGAARDSVKYRTASMLDWATALDHRDKPKAVKCKPIAVRFKFNVIAPTDASYLKVTFSMLTTGEITLGKDKLETVFEWTTPSKEITYDATIVQGDSFQIDGIGQKGKPIKVKLLWGSATGRTKEEVRVFKENIPLLPMPNLHNAGEAIYGGVRQTPLNIIVGIEKTPEGPHTAYHPKYKDVQKSLIKGEIMHDGDARCLDSIKSKPILKRQKSLPPTKHSNKLFAEQLVLKLNVLASDSGIFPHGLGDLIYDNHKKTENPTNPIFDGKTVREIMDQVDHFITCNDNPKDVTADEYYQVIKKINNAFTGPLDTLYWSCTNLRIKGTKYLKDVPTMRANPGVPPLAFQRDCEIVSAVPSAFELYQNYPNPFNPTTTIEFELTEPAIVTLKVYNTLGQEVAVLANNELMDDGIQEIEFDASSLASGVYFYRLVAEGIYDEEEGTFGETHVSVKKMVLMK